MATTAGHGQLWRSTRRPWRQWPSFIWLASLFFNKVLSIVELTVCYLLQAEYLFFCSFLGGWIHTEFTVSNNGWVYDFLDLWPCYPKDHRIHFISIQCITKLWMATYWFLQIVLPWIFCMCCLALSLYLLLYMIVMWLFWYIQEVTPGTGCYGWCMSQPVVLNPSGKHNSIWSNIVNSSPFQLVVPVKTQISPFTIIPDPSFKLLSWMTRIVEWLFKTLIQQCPSELMKDFFQWS